MLDADIDLTENRDFRRQRNLDEDVENILEDPVVLFGVLRPEYYYASDFWFREERMFMNRGLQMKVLLEAFRETFPYDDRSDEEIAAVYDKYQSALDPSVLGAFYRFKDNERFWDRKLRKFEEFLSDNAAYEIKTGQEESSSYSSFYHFVMFHDELEYERYHKPRYQEPNTFTVTKSNNRGNYYLVNYVEPTSTSNSDWTVYTNIDSSMNFTSSAPTRISWTTTTANGETMFHDTVKINTTCYDELDDSFYDFLLYDRDEDYQRLHYLTEHQKAQLFAFPISQKITCYAMDRIFDASDWELTYKTDDRENRINRSEEPIQINVNDDAWFDMETNEIRFFDDAIIDGFDVI